MKKPILALGLVLAAATAARTAGSRLASGKAKGVGIHRTQTGGLPARQQQGVGLCGASTRHLPGAPSQQARANAPLYVVLHSAGHDVHSCLACTSKVGNHDIYHAPKDFFALYLDCRANKGDWWWGINKYPGPEVGPTEKRVVDTVKWVIKHYGIDDVEDPTWAERKTGETSTWSIRSVRRT